MKKSLDKLDTISTSEIIQSIQLSRKMPAVLAELMNQKIIETTATQENIIVTEDELQNAADRFRLENKLISSQDTLKWLEKHYLSVTEFEQSIKMEILSQKLAHHLFQDRVEANFHAHQLDYYQAIVYEIPLDNFNLAMELFYGIQEQELSFWDLAHKYIENDELRRHNGYRGKKTRSQLQPEIAAAVFALNNDRLPQVIKPIAIGKKTYLIYVEEIIQPVLERSLRQQIISQLYQEWLGKQRQLQWQSKPNLD